MSERGERGGAGKGVEIEREGRERGERERGLIE